MILRFDRACNLGFNNSVNTRYALLLLLLPRRNCNRRTNPAVQFIFLLLFEPSFFYVIL